MILATTTPVTSAVKTEPSVLQEMQQKQQEQHEQQQEEKESIIMELEQEKATQQKQQQEEKESITMEHEQEKAAQQKQQQEEKESTVMELEQGKATQEDPPSSPQSVSVSPLEEQEKITLQEDPIPSFPPPTVSASSSDEEEDKRSATEQQQQQQQEEETTTEKDQQQQPESTAAASSSISTTTIAITTVEPTMEQEIKEQEEEDDDTILEEEFLLRKLLSNGLQNISYKERCTIEDEIHGVKSMGYMEEEKDEIETTMKNYPNEGEQVQEATTLTTFSVATPKKDPTFVRTKLQQFNNHLDVLVVRLSPHTDLYKSFFSEQEQISQIQQLQQVPVPVAVQVGNQDQVVADGVVSVNNSNDATAIAADDDADFSSPLPFISTHAYELCQKKDYMYATQKTREEEEEEGSASTSLKLMCLRADLWDAQKASKRFLRHLHMLYEYYGEDALEQPLTLQRFFAFKTNRNKGSSNSTSDATTTTNNTNAKPPKKKRKYKQRGSATAVGVSSSSNSNSNDTTIPIDPSKKKSKCQEAESSTGDINNNNNNNSSEVNNKNKNKTTEDKTTPDKEVKNNNKTTIEKCTPDNEPSSSAIIPVKVVGAENEAAVAVDTTVAAAVVATSTDNNKANSTSTHHMSWLKQGGFQLLPSRDRSGRRVVVFHGLTNDEQKSKVNNSNIHSMFKAMLYFFTTIAKCDLDAQRDGIVLILSASVSSSFSYTTDTTNDNNNENYNNDNDNTNNTSTSSSATSSVSEFFEEFYEFYRSLPIRCNTVHICYDVKNDKQLSTIRLNMIQRLGNEFAQRVRVYDTDACNIDTQKQLATYGIPVYDIPMTESGTLKLKHHYRWIKIQEFFEKQEQIAKETMIQEEKEAITIAAAAAAVAAANQQQRAEAVMSCPSSMYGMYQQQQQQFSQQHFPQHVPSYYGFQQQQQQVMPQLLPQPMLYTSISSLQSSFPLPSCDGQQQKKRRGSKKSNNNSMNNMETHDTIMNNNNNQTGNVEVTVIECPRVNDVLFLRGGKFWNDNNKFQRGNLEFMDIIGSKITAYQDTRSWKKKHEVLMTALNDFLVLTNGTGRFLTNATAQLQGMITTEASPPDGCWIELSLSSPLLMQKVRNLLINHIRRLEKASILLPSSLSLSRKRKNRCTKRAGAEKKVIKKMKIATPPKKKMVAPLKKIPPFKKKIIAPPPQQYHRPVVVATTKSMMKATTTTPITKLPLSLLPSIMKLPLSLTPSPPQPRLSSTTTGKRTLVSIFDNDNIDNNNNINIDIEIDNIKNNDCDDNYNNVGGNNNKDDSRLNHVVNAIVAIDDSLNREVDELFMSSFGDDQDHNCYDIGVGDCNNDGDSLAGNLEDDFPILSIDTEGHQDIDGITDSLLECLF